MAKNNITQYDATAANNTDIDSINIDEGMAASDVNNALRSLMSHLKNVDTGSQALTALSVTGDLTVDTSTLKVDSSNNRVGVGTASPSTTFQVGDGTLDKRSTFNPSNAFAIGVKNGSDHGGFIGSGGADIMVFSNSSGGERLRIDSSGDLMVGSTTTAPHTLSSGGAFTVRGSLNLLSIARADNEAMILNRTSSNGAILQFRKDGTTVGSIGCKSGTMFIGSAESNLRFNFGAGQAVIPATSAGASRDNVIDLGESSARFDDIFATNGSIQTSDRNEKQDIEELSDAEKRVAVVAKGLMRKFRWKDKVAEKGDKARTHFGIIAQDLEDAFKAEGLDASKYAMFCSDTWWEKEISVDAVEADEEKGIESKDAYTYMDTKEEATEGYTEKTRLGVRYSELLAFIISAI